MIFKTFYKPSLDSCFSTRQSLHQEAQKSNNTYFPLNEFNETLFPAVSARVNSGAFLTIACVELYTPVTTPKPRIGMHTIKSVFINFLLIHCSIFIQISQ